MSTQKEKAIERIRKMDPNQQIESWEELKVEVDGVDETALKSIGIYEPDCQFSVLVHKNSLEEGSSDNAENQFESSDFLQPTVWNQNETLALINIFSLHKDKFKLFKKKKHRWILISNELKKIGIDKPPDRCNVKWRNLLRSYRACKGVRNEHGKFEFYNEVNAILTSDAQFKHIVEEKMPEASTERTNCSSPRIKYKVFPDVQFTKKNKCCCAKSEKQMRHEDRMSLLKKKVDLEERKVIAFEEYLQFLRQTQKNQ